MPDELDMSAYLEGAIDAAIGITSERTDAAYREGYSGQRAIDLDIDTNGHNPESYLNGVADAAMGASPSSKDLAYVSGYCERLKQLILSSNNQLVIRWLSPSYSSGGYDAPDDYSSNPF